MRVHHLDFYHFTKGDNFFNDFIFASLDDKVLSKKESALKEKNLLL